MFLCVVFVFYLCLCEFVWVCVLSMCSIYVCMSCVGLCVDVCVCAFACFLYVCYPVHVCINLCVINIHTTIQISTIPLCNSIVDSTLLPCTLDECPCVSFCVSFCICVSMYTSLCVHLHALGMCMSVINIHPMIQRSRHCTMQFPSLTPPY